MKMASYASVSILSLLLSMGIIIAGETMDALIKAGMPLVCAPFSAAVSHSEGSYRFGCVGAFQFCPATLADYSGKSADEFIAHPNDQVIAWLHYQRDQW